MLRGLYVEDKVSGTGLIQTLRREHLPVIAIQRNNDKTSRAYDAAPAIEAGNVALPSDVSWLSDLLEEIESFPAGAHDDQLDPMFDAIGLVQRMPAAVVKTFTPLPNVKKW
jgi:predicted phage terminase large subunit-like protein